MVSIYESLDYRFWLKSILDERRAKNPNFSLRQLAMKADCDASLLSKVIMKKRELSSKVATRIARVFELDTNEHEYLQTLLKMEKAKSSNDKQEYYQKAINLRKVNSRTLTADEHSFYGEWYHSALRNLLQFEAFYGKDYVSLGKKLCPPVSAPKVRSSIDLMTKLGLIEQNDKGRYIIKDLAITSGEKWSSLAIRQYHKTNLTLASESIERFEPAKRDISALTVNVSPKDLEIIRDKIRIFRKEIIEYVSLYAEEKQIYQLNFQLFPLSVLEEDIDENM